MTTENFESIKDRLHRLRQNSLKLSERMLENGPKTAAPAAASPEAAPPAQVPAQAVAAAPSVNYSELLAKINGHEQQMQYASNKLANTEEEKKKLQEQLDAMMQDSKRQRDMIALLQEEKNGLKLKSENLETSLTEAQNKTSYNYVLALVEEFVREFMRHSRDLLGIMYESVHMCATAEETDEDMRKKVKLTEEQVKHLLNVLTESAKKYHFDKIELKMTDLGKLIHNAINGLGGKIPTQGITITTQCPDKPVIISTEYNLFTEALTEILVNSVEAMYKGGTLNIACDVDEKLITVRISDTGCGIPSHLINKVFKPFMTTKQNHFGLGLTRVYWATRLLKYDIQIESTVDKGTKITLAIPVSPGQWSDDRGQ